MPILGRYGAPFPVKKARERAQENAPVLDEAARAVSASGEFGLPADVVLGQRRMRELCAKLLAVLTDGEPHLERLVDGIGLGLRGAKLQGYLGGNRGELATVRRRLKRKVGLLYDKVLSVINDPSLAT